MSTGYLFRDGPIFAALQGQTEAIKKEVQSIPANTMLSMSEHDLIEALIQKFRLDVPVINDDEVYIVHSGETQVDVSGDPMRGFGFGYESEPHYIPGTETIIAVPFHGDAGFFRITPQTSIIGLPPVEIAGAELRLGYVRTDQDGDAIKREYQQTLQSIKTNLASLKQSAESFNADLESVVTTSVRARKDRLLKGAGMTAAIGLPMKKRPGIPETYAVPVQRRTPRIEQVRIAGGFRPEPALSHQDYDEILRIMSSMAQVMELSPSAFAGMEEEALRTHFLVQLNGAYTGQATGETFNFQGKTDILIRVDGKNVFIAECKFWKGEKALLATIDQLLSYLSWRDTKAAAVIFNRNADFGAVLAKIAEVVPKHAHFKRDLGKSGESLFRFVFAQPSDANREITLTVMVFDVPTVPL